MPKPICSVPGCFDQAKKWVWEADRQVKGGRFYCWAHFEMLEQLTLDHNNHLTKVKDVSPAQ